MKHLFLVIQNKKMNQITRIVLLSIVIFGCLISCKSPVDSKESYLGNYESFIDEIKDNKNSYSEKEWKEKDKEFQKFSDEMYSKYQEELGLFEQAKIAKYALVYGSTRGVKALSKALDGNEIENAVNEITKIFDEDIKGDLESAAEELKKVWNDDLKEELEGKLEELKEKLEDEEFKEEITKQVDEIKNIVNDEEIKGKLKDVFQELEDLFQEIEKKVEK